MRAIDWRIGSCVLAFDSSPQHTFTTKWANGILFEQSGAGWFDVEWSAKWLNSSSLCRMYRELVKNEEQQELNGVEKQADVENCSRRDAGKKFLGEYWRLRGKLGLLGQWARKFNITRNSLEIDSGPVWHASRGVHCNWSTPVTVAFSC